MTRVSPLLRVPGFTMDGVALDSLHIVNLGIAPHLAGSAIYDLALLRSGNRTSDSALEEALGSLYGEFRRWCKTHRIPHSQGRFTIKSLRKTRRANPGNLKAKGANCRRVVAWLASHTKAMSDEDPANELLKLLAWACFGLESWWQALEGASLYLTDAQLADLRTARLTYLRAYNLLGLRAVRLRQPGYHQVPKHHIFVHLCEDMERWRLSSLFGATWGDEDMCGRIARLSARTHEKTMPRSTLLRYLARVSLRLAGRDVDDHRRRRASPACVFCGWEPATTSRLFIPPTLAGS